MRKVTVHIRSSENIGVHQDYDLEIDDDCFGPDGKLTDKARDDIWQEAVNNYLMDTYITEDE